MNEKGRENVKRTETLDRVTGLVSYLLVLLPAIFAVLYVRAFGVSVVFSDAWSMVPIFDKWFSDALGFSDLFDQHLEHRMFFPKIVELLLGGITNYDNVAEMYLILACFLVTLLCLLLAFRYSTGNGLWLLLFVPVSLLIFSFRQHENMLWGFQISFAFTQAFGVLALFLLHISGCRRSLKRLAFLAALGSGTIASFSTAQGLLVWPAGLLQLFISPLEKSAKRILVAVWGLGGVTEWIVYFADYERPRNSQSLLYALYHPLVGTEYFFNLLGSPLFWQRNSAFVVGLLLASLTLVSLFLIYKDRKLTEYSFWISLLFYSLLILVSITLGRSGFGAGQALAPRYATFSVLAAASIYAMLARMALERRSSTNTVLLVVMIVAILLSAVVSYPQGIEVGSKERVYRERAAFVLSTYESQPDELLERALHPRAKVVRERAPVLQRLGYNVFSEPQVRSLPPLSGLYPFSFTTPSALTVAAEGISQEGQTVIVPEGTSFVELTGWAVDEENESAAGGVYVEVDDEAFPAFYGTERQNVADSLGVPEYRYSGFERAIPVSEIGVGAHEVSVVVLTADGEGYYRPDQKVALEVR